MEKNMKSQTRVIGKLWKRKWYKLKGIQDVEKKEGNNDYKKGNAKYGIIWNSTSTKYPKEKNKIERNKEVKRSWIVKKKKIKVESEFLLKCRVITWHWISEFSPVSD